MALFCVFFSSRDFAGCLSVWLHSNKIFCQVIFVPQEFKRSAMLRKQHGMGPLVQRIRASLGDHAPHLLVLVMFV